MLDSRLWARLDELKWNLAQGTPNLRIYVDADACPVKEEVLRVAERRALTIVFVANSWMRLPESPLVERIIVSEGADAADDWIVDNVEPGDIVITSDIPLASRTLRLQAAALGHNGKPFTENNIGNALAMRDLNAQLRDAGEIKGYNPNFSKRDRSQFLQALEQLTRSC